MGPPPKTGNLVVRGRSVAAPNNGRPSTTTVRRSSSIGNIPRAVIPAQQRYLILFLCIFIFFRTIASCHCSEPVKETPETKERYTKSLEQQVQLLELENMFLKREQGDDQKSAEQCGTILARGNEVSLNGKDWCRLPDFHPNLEKIIHERLSRSDQGSTRRTNDPIATPLPPTIEKLKEIRSSARDR